MTFLKIKGDKNNLVFLIQLLLLIVIGGVLYISQYNAIAENRYQIRELEQQITQVETLNADIKNNFYQAVNSAKFETIAENHSLILERNPDYMNINQWVSDSSY